MPVFWAQASSLAPLPLNLELLVQLGGGTFSDLQMLVKGVAHMRVEKTRGVTLETRIPVLGNEPGKRNR